MINRFILGAAMLFAVVAPVSANAEIEDFEGYQGFVDIGYTFGTGDYGLNSVDVVTSHGVQIIPTYLFTGIGTGIQYFHEVKKCAIPLFVDVRTCMIGEENVSPFVDLKIGYSAIPDKGNDISEGGIFLNPTIGCTFVIKDFIALNAGIGYTFEQAKIPVIDRRKNIGGFSLRIGIQF